VALLLQSLGPHHFDVASDASSEAAADTSTTTRPTHCTGVLRGSRWSLLRDPAASSTTPAANRGSCLVALDGHVGSTVIGQLLHTMALTPPVVTDWVAGSDASNHTILDAGNLTSVCPLTFTDPSSIIVGNGSALSVTSVGDSVLPSPFYLNNVIVTLDIIQNLLSVHHFTTNNWCSMRFDPFGLSVKDLSARNMIVRCNSLGTLYTMRLPSHPAPSSPTSTPSALVASAST
jgi:hypothetical protein